MLRTLSRFSTAASSASSVRRYIASRALRTPTAANMEQINTTDRLRQLRELMKSKKIDVYVVPSEDAHASEYIAPIDGRREFISGFDGSAGTAVITSDKAALATDGRYFNQASQQLDNNWTLLKQGLQDVPTWQEWAVEQAEGGKTVGVDATTIASPDARKLLEKIKKEGGKDLVALTDNLVDQVWGKDRPARPSKPVKVQKLEHSGKAFQDKIDELRKDIEKKKAAGFVVSMLDDIAWLFNLRGSDIPMNPVFFSYAVITPTTASLYIDDSKLDQEAKDHLKGVTIRPYEAIFSDISALVTSESTNNGADKPTRKYLISTRASWALANALGGEKNVEEIRSLIGDAKAVKNEVEMQGMRDCHVRDGAALTQYFAWLEEELITKKTKLDEVDAANKLAEIRATKDMFVGCSFDTISASGPNAAIMHYNPQPGSCSVIDPTKIYLCDSGAQYTDGTTDTTRTLHFGTPTEKEIETYTLVLKGHIAMDMAVFPKGTSGFALDVLARQFLWQNGLEYRHGTGHGVGSFLNVHEGPIGIGTRISYTEVPLAIGNVISNEPGYYEDGSFGIRIENMFMVKEVKTKHKFGDKPYFGFEYVTMVPMCRKLVNLSMLTEVEKNWLNTYHQKVSEKLKPLLAKDELSLKWLERECATY